MTATKAIRYLAVRGLLFSSLASGQSAPAPVDPCKPAAAPAGVQKEEKKAAGKLSGWLGKAASKATGGAIDSGDVKNIAGSAGAKPAPCQAPAKPAAPALRELCPPNTSRVEGQPYCVTPDGNKLVDVIRIPASASTPPR